MHQTTKAENGNTNCKPWRQLVYQVWLDTTKFDANNKGQHQSVGISDDYDETVERGSTTRSKAYDSVTGTQK